MATLLNSLALPSIVAGFVARMLARFQRATALSPSDMPLVTFGIAGGLNNFVR